MREDGPVTHHHAESALERAVVDIESHVHESGWDLRPMLFALVRAERFLADDPSTARQYGLDEADPDFLAPIEQEELPDQPLDEVLASIEWPEAVTGCAIVQEILILPPSVEAELGDNDDAAVDIAASHPQRREARLVAGVLRDGTSSAVIRMRDEDPTGDPESPAAGDLLTGPNLAPNMVEALLATLG
jgi:hypothetical protein